MDLVNSQLLVLGLPERAGEIFLPEKFAKQIIVNKVPVNPTKNPEESTNDVVSAILAIMLKSRKLSR